MGFKSGHESITHDKVNGSLDLQTDTTVTVNGLRGLITITNNDSAWGTGAARGFGIANSFIQADSLVNICFCTNGGTAWIPMIRAVYNVAAGSCTIALINARAEIAANATLYLAYEVVN